METIEEDVEVEEKEYSIDDLKGRARDRALEWVRERQFNFDWWDYTYDWWVTEKFAEYGIYGVEKKNICFDLYRSQFVNFGSGWLNLKEVAALKPEWFANVYLSESIRMEWLVDANFTCSDYNCTVDMDTRLYNSDFSGSVFEGADNEAFNIEYARQLNELEGTLKEYVNDIQREFCKELQEESDYLESDECLVEQANGNDWKFDAEGNKL